MGRDNNFTKAVKELLNNEPPADPRAGESAANSGSAYGSASQAPAPGYSSSNTAYTPDAGRSATGAYAAAPTPTPYAPSVSSGEVTIITRDTVVTGSISSKANIRMDGQMTGDIITDRDIHITGKVDGNVDGDNILLNDGAIVGDLAGKAAVTVDSTAVVIGNVTSDCMESDGRVKGSIKVNTNVCLKKNAVVFGNITSRSLNVEDGAVLRGNVQVISSRTDDEDLFAISRKGRSFQDNDRVLQEAE